MISRYTARVAPPRDEERCCEAQCPGITCNAKTQLAMCVTPQHGPFARQAHDRLERHTSASDSDGAVRPGRERWELWFECLHQVNDGGNHGPRPVPRNSSRSVIHARTSASPSTIAPGDRVRSGHDGEPSTFPVTSRAMSRILEAATLAWAIESRHPHQSPRSDLGFGHIE